MSEVTHILSQIEQGDPRAAEKLLPLVYDKLRTLAAARLAQEKPGQTLQATALVHEVYLRLVGEQEKGKQNGRGEWNSRGHFFAAAAEAMRRILVERARQKAGPRRGGKLARISLDDCDPPDDRPAEILAVHDAIDVLAAESRGLAFAGRYAFVGLSKIRPTSAMDGVPLADHRQTLKCGIAAVDLETGAAIGLVEFQTAVEEIFDVQVLPGIRFPEVIGLQKEEVLHTFVLPPASEC